MTFLTGLFQKWSSPANISHLSINIESLVFRSYLVAVKAMFNLPTEAKAQAWLDSVKKLPITYWERGATAWERMPQEFTHDEQRIKIGSGDVAWRAAKQAIRAWKMFPSDWIKLSDTPQIEVGEQVLVIARLLGLWWSNPARIVYTVEEKDRFGFAYGTLPGHLEQGEELFLVERDAQGDVYYTLRVMSRPIWWAAKLFKSFARMQQARFRMESFLSMRAALGQTASRIEKFPKSNPPSKQRALQGYAMRAQA